MRTNLTASIACLALPLTLSGQVQLSEISVTPEAPYSLSVGYGQSTTLDLTVNNSNSAEGTDLTAYFSDGISADLDGALSSLNSNIDSLLGIIPERYLFRDGITGTYISDGGGDMYDGGNYLRFGTNTSTALTYSDNLVTSTVGVNSTEYFTRKYDGLFVLGADYGTNTGFHITGNLGADGSGSVTLLDFDPGYGYHAYFKVVHSAGDPSINQLILVPKGSSLVRTSPTTTSYDTHSVAGLPENGRLYYLLFAKSSGQTFPESDVLDLAEQFLSLVNPGPAWFDFPEVSIGANSSENIQVTLDAQGLASGLYTTDFAISPDHLSADTIPTGQFTQLSLTVESSAFSPVVDTVEVGTIPNYSPDLVEIALQPAVAGQLPNISVVSSESWAIPEVVPNQNTIRVSFNLSTLNAGTHKATISITSGRTTQEVEVVVTVNELNIVKLLPDPMRPRLYAINQNEKNQGNLIVYDTLTQAITDVVPLGNEPSDMDLTENSEELLVINTSDPSIQRIDLDTLAVTDTYQLTEFSNRNDDYGAHVADGPGDIIYYVDEQWGPRLRVFDTNTGSVLQTFSSASSTSPDTSNNYGYGDIVVSPDRSRLFGWSQYGDGAGNISTGVTGFNITSGGLLSGYSKSETYLRVTNFERDPFDTPAMMTEDGSTLIIKNRVVDQQDLDTFPTIYPDEILSISPQAEIVSGANAIYSGITSETFFTFPTSNQRVQAILPDYSHLAYFNASNNQLTWLDLTASVGSENLGLGQEPAEGSTVFPPDQLNWLPTLGYGRYDVYLGTSPTAVAAAGTTSPEYLGVSTGTRIILPSSLTPGATYYWRVDGRSANGIQTGSVMSFTVANIDTQVDSISQKIPEGAPINELQIVPFSGTPGTNWSATTTSPWISFQRASGSTQNNLEFRLNTQDLPVGEYSGIIQISLGGSSVVAHEIEIEIEVSELDIVKLLPDPMRPRMYAINQDEQDQGNLIVYNTLTEAITHLIPLGNEPSDMDLTENSEELLVINTSDPSIQRIDLDTLAISATYPLTEFSDYNNDFGAHIADGPGNTIYYVDEERGPRLRVYDTSTQSVLQTFSSADGTTPSTNAYGYGDIVVSPDRTRLYGWSQYATSSTGLTLVRFDIANDGQLGGFISTESSYSETNFRRFPFNTPPILTADGSTLILKDRSIDQDDLDQFYNIYPDEIYSITPQAEIVSGPYSIYSGDSSEVLYQYGQSVSIQTILPDFSNLVYLDTSNNELRWLDLSSTIGLDELGLSQQPAEGVTLFPPDQLSWLPTTGYGSYDVYLGTNARAVATATRTSPSYLGGAVGAKFQLPEDLELGATYYWRVDSRNSEGTTAGPIMSFTVADIDTDIDTIELSIPEGAPTQNQEISFTGDGNVGFSASTVTPWLQVINSAGVSGDGLTLGFDTRNLLPGEYSGEVNIFLDGSATVVHTIAVEIIVNELNLVQLLPDPMRPRLYAINQNEEERGELIVFDTQTRIITTSIPLGNEPSDMDLTENSEELLVINTSDPSIQRIDLDNLEITDTYHLTEFSYYNNDTGAHVADGPGNIIYYLDEQRGPRLRVYDASTQTVLQTFSSADGTTPSTNAYGYGDIVVSPDRTKLYGWSQYSSSSSMSLVRFDIADDGQLGGFINTDSSYSETNFRTYPYNTPPMMSADGSDLIIKDRSVNLDDLDLFQNIYPDEILSISPQAEIVSGATAIYSGDDSETLYSFPRSTQVQTVLPDYSYLVYFDTTQNQLSWLDLEVNVGATNLGLAQLPADGATVFPPDQLSWLPINGYGSYNVYFGTNASAVASASPTSSEFVGVAMSPRFNLPTELELGSTYYWRVDGRSSNGIQTGTVQSFTLPLIDAAPHAFLINSPEGAPSPDQEVQFSGTTGISWSASTSTPWLQVLTPSGNTETTLRFRPITENLSPGDYSGDIEFVIGANTINIPVELNVLPLDIVKLKSISAATHVYALSETPPLDGPSFLLEIDPATASITRYIECGREVIDFSIDRDANQAFVIAEGGDEVLRFNLPNWLNEGSIDISSLSTRTPQRIIAAPDGNFLIGESYTLYSVNVDTGESIEFLSSTASTYNRGYFSEDGSTLYVASSSRIAQVRYDSGMFSDFVQSEASSRINYDISIAGRPTVNRIFAGTLSYDSEMNINWYYDEEILATDSQGVICLGESELYWSESGIALHSFTENSTVTTISSDDQYILRYFSNGRRLVSIPLSDYLILPGPNIQPSQVLNAAPERLSVPPVEGVTAYRFYFGASPDSLNYIGQSSEPSIEFNAAIPSYGKFYWRVDYVINNFVASNPAYDFVILPEAFETGIAGVEDSLHLQQRELLSGTSDYPDYDFQINSLNPLTGEIGEAISHERSGEFSTSSPFAKQVVKAGGDYFTIDTDGLYRVEIDERGYISKKGVFPLPDDALPASLSASGDLIFVSTRASNYPDYENTIYVYRTYPELVLEATIETPELTDGTVVRYFGSHFSAFGDHLAVRGYLYNSTSTPRVQTEAVCIYRRDHSTSTWSLIDTETISNATPSYYNNSYFDISSDDGLIAVASNIRGTPQVSVLREQADGTFDTEAFIDSSEFPEMRNSLIHADVDQDQIAIAFPSAGIGPEYGAIFVIKYEDNDWHVKHPLTHKTASTFAYTLSLADGWLATTADYQVLLYDIGAENTRPLITSPRPFQLVYERGFEIPLSFDDTEGDTVEMSLAPDLDWVSIESTTSGFVLSGRPPNELPETTTLRITATDQAGTTDIQTFDVSLLSPTDVPIVVSLSPSQTLGVGQDLTLRADISGTGPFAWQWYKDGDPISGATQSTFVINYISMEDADTYTARITNAVGTTETDEIEIQVRPANRFAGDWPMFGGSSAHLGFHPATLDTTHLFVEEWSESISTNYINRVAVAENKVFVTPYVRFNGPDFAYCFDLDTGNELWTHSFPVASSLNPPSYHNGRIYVQRVKGINDNSTELWSLDSQSGETIWSASHGAQWERYESPTVTDDGIWINGGSYGGMYGFDVDGTQRFFERLAQYDDWTPTYANGKLYSWVAGIFIEHNPGSGDVVWKVNAGWDWSGWSMNTVSAVTSSEAMLISTTDLICVDLNARDVRWRVEKRFLGSPALNQDDAYAIYRNNVETYDLETGAPGLVYVTGDDSNLYSEQPLLLNEHMFVATADKTFIFEIGNPTPIQTLPVGGRLSYSQGYLLIAGSSGQLTAYFANDVPDFISNPPNITADAAGSDESLDISQYVYDADEDDQLKYAIVGNTNPSIFSNVTIGATDGQLNVRFAPYVYGSSDVTIRVSDPDNTYSEYTIVITLPEIPDLEITEGPIAINRQTGLYEQTLTVKNVGGRAVGGFEIQVSELEGDFQLLGYEDGLIGYYQPVGSGESVALTLQYYSPTTALPPSPEFEQSHSYAPVDPEEALTLGVPVDRIVAMEDGSILIEFPSIPGHVYAIQYSYDMEIWYQSSYLSLAGANRTQWIDDGMPKTDQHPSKVPSKFYRVLDITE